MTPCEVCGNLPCTCEGGKKKRKVLVKLGKLRELTLYTDWNEKFLYEGNKISIDEFITIPFGRLPQFFDSEMDLRLDQLKREGFDQEKLQRVQSLISAENSDLLDVLECLAFHTTPMAERCLAWSQDYARQFLYILPLRFMTRFCRKT